MRVFFTASDTAGIEYQAYVTEVLQTLLKHKVAVITPEDLPQKTVKESERQDIETFQAQYAFTTQGIAEADIIIAEASSGDFRMGHEVTLALLYAKPTLVLSQKTDYSGYISHQLLYWEQYSTRHELKGIVSDFINKAKAHLTPLRKNIQTIGQTVDVLHAAALSPLRHNALRDQTEFGEWARLAEKDPEKACKKVLSALGKLPVQPAWSVFAPIYNEDTPDYIFDGAANLVQDILNRADIPFDGVIVDVDAKTGSFVRNLAARGYSHLEAVESSREMLAEAFRLCASTPAVKITEGGVSSLELVKKADAIVWMDYSSNFALTSQELQGQLEGLLKSIRTGGRLVFDIRTVTGWGVTFFRQRIATVSTPRFQRVSIRNFDQTKGMIHFDRFIRTKNSSDSSWNEWRREQMTERMWTLSEVKAIITAIPRCRLEAVYDDNFARIHSDVDQEPGLAYIEIKKI